MRSNILRPSNDVDLFASKTIVYTFISIVNLWKLFQEKGRAGLEDLPSVDSVHHVLLIILRKYS